MINLGITLLNNLFINAHKAYKEAENEKIKQHLHSNFEDFLILSKYHKVKLEEIKGGD
jgi:hypothetical protein